jgi:iron complex transport system substrate-binding protein
VRYTIVPCDRAVPPGADADADAVFAVPLGRLVTTSSTQLPQIEALGLTDRLIGHDRFDYVTSAPLRKRIDAGLMTAVGDGVRLNTEILLDLRPDLVFVFSIGSPELDLLGGLRDAGIPFAIDAAWVESTPLARAEWIKYTATFFDREDDAERLFGEIADRYEELVALARGVGHRPTVLTGAPFRGTWHVSGGRGFQARFIADAGGEYLWSDDDSHGSIPLDLEAVYARGLDAEVWVHPSDWRSLDDAVRADPRMADFRAFREDRIYNNDRRMNDQGGNDYWESGSLRPDRVLADFIWILHPDLLPDHEPVFHRRLPQHRNVS